MATNRMFIPIAAAVASLLVATMPTLADTNAECTDPIEEIPRRS